MFDCTYPNDPLISSFSVEKYIVISDVRSLNTMGNMPASVLFPMSLTVWQRSNKKIHRTIAPICEFWLDLLGLFHVSLVLSIPSGKESDKVLFANALKEI